MSKDIDFSKINAVSIAEQLYGTKKEYSWPGPALADTIDAYRDTCYGIIARFNGYDQTSNLEKMKQIEAGQKCYEGIVQQYKKYGKHTQPYKRKIDQLIIPFYPPNFKNAYLDIINKKISKDNKNGNTIETYNNNKELLEQAYQKCLRMSQNNQQQQQCLLDKMALENTLPKTKKQPPLMKSKPPPLLMKSKPPLEQSEQPEECNKCNKLSIIIWIILIIILVVLVLLKIYKKI